MVTRHFDGTCDSHAPLRRRLVAALGAAPLAACSLSGPALISALQSDRPPPLSSTAPYHMPFTHQFDLMIAGEMRRVFIARPASADAPAQGYALIVTVDGNALFPMLAHQVRMQASRPGAGAERQFIVVGIGHAVDSLYDMQARALDYTPTSRADQLLDYVQGTLNPWLAAQLPIDDARRTVLGHSYGGLFVLNALFTRPGLFRHHVAASPSIWWGDRAILALRDRYLRQSADNRASGTTLLVTAGSLEEDTVGDDLARMQRQQERRQVTSARTLVASLESVPGLRSRFQLLADKNHGSVVAPTIDLAIQVAASRRSVWSQPVDHEAGQGVSPS